MEKDRYKNFREIFHESVVEAVPGLVTLTTSGHGHSIKNTGDEDLVLIALILFD